MFYSFLFNNLVKIKSTDFKIKKHFNFNNFLTLIITIKKILIKRNILLLLISAKNITLLKSLKRLLFKLYITIININL